MNRACLGLVFFLTLVMGLEFVPAHAAGKVYKLEASARVRDLRIVMHNTDVLMFGEEIGSYAVGDPEIADVLPIRGSEAYLQGKRLGTTNLTVMSADGARRAVFNIEVTLNTKGIARAIRKAEPGAEIDISTTNGRVVLSGVVPNVPASARILEIASKFVDDPGDVINAMTISDAQQVMLEVRFLEVNRTIGKELGVNWLARSSNGVGKAGQLPYYSDGGDAAGSAARGLLDPLKVIGSSSFATVLAQFTVGGVDVDVAIRAMEDKGVTRRLAEPNLVALSGQEATFLAGGELPYAVDQGDGRTTTEFKKYGVQLTFTPTVLRDDVVNLKLVPEFSQPDFANAGKDGQPGLLTRRADTMVELRDGQTFVIAGLLDGFNQRDIDQVPGIGKVPVLGALFRSSGYRKRETELIIVVTPRIVRPMVPGTPLETPLNTLTSSTEAELFLNGQTERKPARKKPRDAKGQPVGHILDIGG